MLSGTQRKVLYELKQGPRTSLQLSQAAKVSIGMVQFAVSILRKNDIKIFTVGAWPYYHYEYAAKQ